MSKFNLPVQPVPTLESAYAEVLGGKSDTQIVNIPNEQIIENNNQHFKIHEDTIEQLAERIAKDGQLNPCIVSPLPDGRYELIDGRHRRRAVIKAGLPTTKCIIRNDLSEQQKASFRISLNLFRNNDYLPSEIALSLKELIEIEGSYDAIKKVSDETNTSRKKVYRYIRLTHLIKPLLDRVDTGVIPVIAAVELSYLSEQEQNQLFQFLLNHSDCKITTAIAREIKENPTKLEDIFYPPNLDNLSKFPITDESEVNTPTATDTIKADTHNPVDYIKSAKLESIEKEVQIQESDTDTDIKTMYSLENNKIIDVNDISAEHLKIIAKAIINHTKVDYFIIKKFYNSREVLDYFNEKYIKHYSARYCYKVDGYNLNFDFHYRNRMFCIEVEKQKYIFNHKELEKIIRDYIRNFYSVDEIISILQGNENE